MRVLIVLHLLYFFFLSSPLKRVSGELFFTTIPERVKLLFDLRTRQGMLGAVYHADKFVHGIRAVLTEVPTANDAAGFSNSDFQVYFVVRAKHPLIRFLFLFSVCFRV